MAGLNDIPGEVRWRIAAEFSARLPALYDAAFRPVAGVQFNEIEQEIWMELARTSLAIARDLSLPTTTAQELADTMRIVMVILFGPGFKTEMLEVSKDGAVILIRRCPILSESAGAGEDGERTFHRCMAFMLTGIPILNQNYTARFVRTMCTGDRQCEIKIAPKEVPAPIKSGKK